MTFLVRIVLHLEKNTEKYINIKLHINLVDVVQYWKQEFILRYSLENHIHSITSIKPIKHILLYTNPFLFLIQLP